MVVDQNNIAFMTNAFWIEGQPHNRVMSASRFNSLAHVSGMQMGAHDYAIGVKCDPANWPYHSSNNQVRRAAFEAGYMRGYKEMEKEHA